MQPFKVFSVSVSLLGLTAELVSNTGDWPCLRSRRWEHMTYLFVKKRRVNYSHPQHKT